MANKRNEFENRWDSNVRAKYVPISNTCNESEIVKRRIHTETHTHTQRSVLNSGLAFPGIHKFQLFEAIQIQILLFFRRRRLSFCDSISVFYTHVSLCISLLHTDARAHSLPLSLSLSLFLSLCYIYMYALQQAHTHTHLFILGTTLKWKHGIAWHYKSLNRIGCVCFFFVVVFVFFFFFFFFYSLRENSTVAVCVSAYSRVARRISLRMSSLSNIFLPQTNN